jgi:hypothetical protein
MANKNDKTDAQQRRAKERADARRKEDEKKREKEAQQRENNGSKMRESHDYNTKFATDADRALTNQRGGQARRDERAANWNSGDAFDVNKYGKDHVSGQEMQRMKDDGMSMEDIQARTGGMEMTERATRKLNRMQAKEKAQVVVENPVMTPAVMPGGGPIVPETTPNTPGTPTPPLQPGTTTPKPTTWDPMPTPEPGVTTPVMPNVQPGVGPTIIGDTGDVGKKGDMTTTIGDGNTIIGSPIGNDYSVTIGNTGNMSGGGSGGSGLSNMMGAAAYSALNNNAYNTSQSQVNGPGVAATASANAELRTGATDRVANLYNMVGESQMYWKNKADAQQGLYLGDVWNQGGHKWTQAPNPEFTEDKTSDILNDDDDD